MPALPKPTSVVLSADQEVAAAEAVVAIFEKRMHLPEFDDIRAIYFRGLSTNIARMVNEHFSNQLPEIRTSPEIKDWPDKMTDQVEMAVTLFYLQSTDSKTVIFEFAIQYHENGSMISCEAQMKKTNEGWRAMNLSYGME